MNVRSGSELDFSILPWLVLKENSENYGSLGIAVVKPQIWGMHPPNLVSFMADPIEPKLPYNNTVKLGKVAPGPALLVINHPGDQYSQEEPA